MHALQLPTSSDTSLPHVTLFSTSLLYGFNGAASREASAAVTCIFERPHAMSSMLPLRSDVPVFPF